MINMQSLFQMMQQGVNPNALLNQMAQQNPALQQALGLLNGKNQQQQMQVLEDMARQRGTTLQQVAHQMGIPWK